MLLLKVFDRRVLHDALAYCMTELCRTGEGSKAASIDLRIIFDRFLGGRLSSGSGTGEIGGEREGTGDTGLLLGGVTIASSSEWLASTSKTASTRLLKPSHAFKGVYCTVGGKFAGCVRAATTSWLFFIRLNTNSGLL